MRHLLAISSIVWNQVFIFFCYLIILLWICQDNRLSKKQKKILQNKAISLDY